MNKVVGLLTMCVACAVLRAAVVALVVAMIIALLWSFITQPRETLLLLGILALMGLVNAHPLACIIAIGVIGLAAVLVRSKGHREASRSQPSTRDASPHARLEGDGPR